MIEERHGKLSVQTGGQFVINQRDTTNDLGQRIKIITREERDSIRRIAIGTRAQTEDQKFLAEEDARRRSFADAQIACLCSTIGSARREIARLKAKGNESVSSGGEMRAATTDEARSDGIAADLMIRRKAVPPSLDAVLQTHIADRDRQIQILSDAIAGWEMMDLDDRVFKLFCTIPQVRKARSYRIRNRNAYPSHIDDLQTSTRTIDMCAQALGAFHGGIVSTAASPAFRP